MLQARAFSHLVRTAVLMAVTAAAIAGCEANAIKESYRSSLERWPSGEVSRLVLTNGPIQIVSSNDIEEDATRMMENGYLLLGRSKFRSEQIDPEAAREAARDLRASVVLVKAQHAKTVVEAIPVDRWMGSRPQTSGRSGGRPMHGEYRITYMRRPVDYFDYSATFWAKSKPPIFGVLVEGTGGETKQADPSGAPVAGKGVVIRAVINDSPASRAGLLRGDVVVRFADVEISDPDQFFDTVVANKGKNVEVEVVRPEGAKQMKLNVQLMNE